jgi:hypothetical protein
MLLPKTGLHRFPWTDTPENKFVPFQFKLMGVTVVIGVLTKALNAIKLKITEEVFLVVNLPIISTNKICQITDVTKIGLPKFVSVV